MCPSDNKLYHVCLGKYIILLLMQPFITLEETNFHCSRERECHAQALLAVVHNGQHGTYC